MQSNSCLHLFNSWPGHKRKIEILSFGPWQKCLEMLRAKPRVLLAETGCFSSFLAMGACCLLHRSLLADRDVRLGFLPSVPLPGEALNPWPQVSLPRSSSFSSEPKLICLQDLPDLLYLLAFAFPLCTPPPLSLVRVLILAPKSTYFISWKWRSQGMQVLQPCTLRQGWNMSEMLIVTCLTAPTCAWHSRHEQKNKKLK